MEQRKSVELLKEKSEMVKSQATKINLTDTLGKHWSYGVRSERRCKDKMFESYQNFCTAYRQKKEQEKIKENDTQVYREDVVISSMP